MNNRLMKSVVAGLVIAASSLGFASSANASLLTPTYETQLSSWLGQGSLTFTNIYAAGTGDSTFNSSDWHAAVDGKGATFTLMGVLTFTQQLFNGRFVTIGDSIVGGYNPMSWNSVDNYHFAPTDAERTAFIYNLSTNVLLRQILSTDANGGYPTSLGQYQTFNNPSFGPLFGNGDLRTNFSTSGVYPYSYGTSFGPGLFGIGIANFQVERVETYTFSNTNNVPEPSTIALIAMAFLSLFGIGLMRMRAEA